MNNNYDINKLRVQQFGLTTTIKDDSGKEHHFYRGHEYIEIGGIKWAVTNVGAEKETDSGLYFAFGEKQGYTAEQVHRGERRFDEKGYTNVEFDSVNVYWGGKWRLPTEAEFQSLLYSTTAKWVKNYQGRDINGRLFTDRTDSSKKLFFPSAGCCHRSGIYHVGSFGYYWTNTLKIDYLDYGRNMSFNSWYSTMNYNCRFFGFPIRGLIGE